MHQKRSKKITVRNEIFKTLIYSDLFSYPLTGDQLFQYLGVPLTRKIFLKTIGDIPHCIHKNTIYYFLPERDFLVQERIQKEKYSMDKIKRAKKIAKFLSFFPTIQYIGISGSLAMKNADRKSDIDLFFITKTHTVWLTRFLVYIFLYVFGLKRNKKNIALAICANMFFDEEQLSFTQKKRNLYTAHEIAQIVSLINKNYTYEKFILTNKWIRKYFPNMKRLHIKSRIPRKLHPTFWKLFLPIEYIFWQSQLWYMRNKKTREIVDLQRIAFHPIDYESKILVDYSKKCIQ